MMVNENTTLYRWQTVIPCVVFQTAQERSVFPPIPFPRAPAPKAQRTEMRNSRIMATMGFSARQQKVMPMARTTTRVRIDCIQC